MMLYLNSCYQKDITTSTLSFCARIFLIQKVSKSVEKEFILDIFLYFFKLFEYEKIFRNKSLASTEITFIINIKH